MTASRDPLEGLFEVGSAASTPRSAGPPEVRTDSAPSRLERTLIWRLKLRLQFTGWLQYLAPAFLALPLLVLAALGALVGVAPILLVGLPLTVGVLLLLVIVFDLVTVRLDVRPRESHPPRLDGLNAFDVMRARRSCRSFQCRALTEADRAALMTSVRQHAGPQELLGSAPIRLEYVAIPLTVWPVVGAHEFLVAVAPREYDRVSVIDVGRSLQKVVIEATRAGISTCWIGPGADQGSVVAALGDRFDVSRDHVICVCAVGYRSRFVPLSIRLMNLKMHRRLPLDQLFFTDSSLTSPLDVTKSPYDQLGRCYEVCQWSPSSYNGQTTRASIQAGDVVERVDFASSTASRYYAPVALGIWAANWEMGCKALGIHGRTTVLPQDLRAIADGPGLPGYGATWLREAPTTT